MIWATQLQLGQTWLNGDILEANCCKTEAAALSPP